MTANQALVKFVRELNERLINEGKQPALALYNYNSKDGTSLHIRTVAER